MRNLIEYPIQYEELMDALETAQLPHVHDIGGIDGACLHLVSSFLALNELQVREFLRELQSLSSPAA